MLHRLDPLDLSLEFDDRSYRLGETIAARVQVTSKGRIDVREASAELLCDQKFAETYTVSRAGRYSTQGVVAPRQEISSQVGDERVESYVHSSAAFLSDVTLEAGEQRTVDVRIAIDAAPPRRLDDARALDNDAARSWSFSWRLVVSVDVAGGRDASVERDIRCGCSECSTGPIRYNGCCIFTLVPQPSPVKVEGVTQGREPALQNTCLRSR